MKEVYKAVHVKRGKFHFLALIGEDAINVNGHGGRLVDRLVVYVKCTDKHVCRGWFSFTETVIPKGFIGKAICNPSDQFEEEFGIQLAVDRAIHRIYSQTKQKSLRRIKGELAEIFHGSGYNKPIVRADG